MGETRGGNPRGLSVVLRQQVSFEASRFSCMEFQGVSGVFDYAGLIRDSRLRPGSCCLPFLERCRRPGPYFTELNTQPTYTSVYASRPASRQDSRKTRGRVVRYSFHVRLLHPLLHAGLARRTQGDTHLLLILIWLCRSSCPKGQSESGRRKLREAA